MPLILDLSPAARAHLGVALHSHGRSLERSGRRMPAELVALAAMCLPRPGDDTPLLDRAAAATRLGIGITTLGRITASGELPSTRIRGRRVYRPADLTAYCELQTSRNVQHRPRISA